MNTLARRIEAETFADVQFRRVAAELSADQKHDDVYRRGIAIGVVCALAEIQKRHPEFTFHDD